MKFQHNQRLDTWDTLEELSPGDRITIDGNPATVFDVVEGDEIYIVYVLDGKKTKKELSMFDALLPSETEEDEEDYDDFYYEDGEPQSELVDEKPEVEVRYIAPGKDLFDEPGIRKSPGRRNRPMTSHVPPIAEGKTMKITKRQLRKIIKEEKQKILNEVQGDYHPKWTIEYDSDGSVWAIGYDEDNLDKEMTWELDPAKISAAIESGSFDKEKKKGPPAGSMPWSQSPVNPKNR